jgi:hypothetical protein
MEYWAEQAASGNSTGNPNATVEALLQDMIGLLQQVQTQTDGIELTSDNIKLIADAINLNTDQVEALLSSLDTRAIASTLSLSVIQAQLAGFQPLIDGIEGLLTNLFTSSTAIESQLSNIESVSGDTNTLLAAIDAKLVQLLVKPEAQLVELFIDLIGGEQFLGLPNTYSQGVLLKAVKTNGDFNARFVSMGSASGQLRFRLEPGEERSIDPPSGGYLDLSQIIVQGQLGDGLAIWTMSYGTPNA